ncbi:MAG: ethanolamine ammonia-lyase subunit EutC [Bacillota bacterium]|nr:ethanolamine ammonia-lyase subunit EutC [Bacillota bacterium]
MAEYNNEMERKIVESVLAELRKSGGATPQTTVSINTPNDLGVSSYDEGVIELPDISVPMVDEPYNQSSLEAMKRITNARIALGRCGTRQRTDPLIRFLADHAAARDAVFLDVSDEFLRRNNLEVITTEAATKEQFLTEPNRGTVLSPEGRRTLAGVCKKGAQVQIIITDGLSSRAIERNIEDIMPPLLNGLQGLGVTVGTPVFVKNGRVRVMDDIGVELGCDVVVNLIGERPGLGTASSMSAYLIYKPTKETVEADRTLISNIYKGGTPPVEAGAQLVELIKNILQYKASGVKLNELTK